MKVTRDELIQVIQEECQKAVNIIRENKMLTEKFGPDVTAQIKAHGGLKNSGYKYDARTANKYGNFLDTPLDKGKFKGLLDAETAKKLRDLGLFGKIQNYVVELNDGNYAVMDADVDDKVDYNAKKTDRDKKFFQNKYKDDANSLSFDDISTKSMVGDAISSMRTTDHRNKNHK